MEVFDSRDWTGRRESLLSLSDKIYNFVYCYVPRVTAQEHNTLRAVNRELRYKIEELHVHVNKLRMLNLTSNLGVLPEIEYEIGTYRAIDRQGSNLIISYDIPRYSQSMFIPDETMYNRMLSKKFHIDAYIYELRNSFTSKYMPDLWTRIEGSLRKCLQRL